MLKKPSIKIVNQLSIAFETNGNGYIGYVVELPGAFVRGKTEEEAIAKVNREVNLYLKWLGLKSKTDYRIQIVQRHQSNLRVEDADNEILLEADKGVTGEEDLGDLFELVRYSGESFLQLYTKTKLKDWVDEKRIRKTFYGDNPKCVQEIFDHVKACQYYYLSRSKVPFEKKEEDFLKIRGYCLEKIEGLYGVNKNSTIYEVDDELWTLKKILRRFIWHDRIHGKAIVRILEKQKQSEVINRYEDLFCFMEET